MVTERPVQETVEPKAAIILVMTGTMMFLATGVCLVSVWKQMWGQERPPHSQENRNAISPKKLWARQDPFDRRWHSQGLWPAPRLLPGAPVQEVKKRELEMVQSGSLCGAAGCLGFGEPRNLVRDDLGSRKIAVAGPWTRTRKGTTTRTP